MNKTECKTVFKAQTQQHGMTENALIFHCHSKRSFCVSAFLTTCPVKLQFVDSVAETKLLLK
jgi:hypothetical protein